MRQAITTTYHTPTEHRAARVTAKAQAGRLTAKGFAPTFTA